MLWSARELLGYSWGITRELIWNLSVSMSSIYKLVNHTDVCHILDD